MKVDITNPAGETQTFRVCMCHRPETGQVCGKHHERSHAYCGDCFREYKRAWYKRVRAETRAAREAARVAMLFARKERKRAEAIEHARRRAYAAG